MGNDTYDSNVTDMPSAKWQLDCELTIYNAASLLRLSGRFCASSAIIELIRNMPRSESEMEVLIKIIDEEFAQQRMMDKVGYSYHSSLFVRCIIEAFHYSKNETAILASVAGYWKNFATMPSHQRDILEASIVGVLTGLGMG